MKPTELFIRFADLRRLTTTVQAYLAKAAGEKLPFPLTTRIEDDLGISGADMVELLENFTVTYHVDATCFDFTGLISPEGLDSWGCVLAVPVGFYWLAAKLVKSALAVLYWPFNQILARRIWQWPIPLPTFGAANQPPPLTVADFVASAAAGHFVRRAQVRFRLVP